MAGIGNALAYLFSGFASGAVPAIKQRRELDVQNRRLDQEQQARAAELRQRKDEFAASNDLQKKQFNIFKQKSDIEIPEMRVEAGRKAKSFEQSSAMNEQSLAEMQGKYGEWMAQAPLRKEMAGTQRDVLNLEAGQKANQLAISNKQVANYDSDRAAELKARETEQAMKDVHLQAAQNELGQQPMNFLDKQLSTLGKFAEMTGIDLANTASKEVNKTVFQANVKIADMMAEMRMKGVPPAQLNAAKADMARILNTATVGYMQNMGITDQDLIANTDKAQKLRGLMLQMAHEVFNGKADAWKHLDMFGHEQLKELFKNKLAAESQPIPQGETGKPSKEPNLFKNLIDTSAGDALLPDEQAAAKRLGLDASVGLDALVSGSGKSQQPFRAEMAKAGKNYLTVGGVATRVGYTNEMKKAGYDKDIADKFATFTHEHPDYTKDSLLDYARVKGAGIDQATVDAWMERALKYLQMQKSIGGAINDETIKISILKGKPQEGRSGVGSVIDEPPAAELSTIEKIFGY